MFDVRQATKNDLANPYRSSPQGEPVPRNETTSTGGTSTSVRVDEGVETCGTLPSLWDQGRGLALPARPYNEVA